MNLTLKKASEVGENNNIKDVKLEQLSSTHPLIFKENYSVIDITENHECDKIIASV